MKDKCGGGIKEKKCMCMKVWENLVEKLGVVNYAWCVKKKRKKNTEKRHMKKNGERKEKWEERKIQKQGMCKSEKKKKKLIWVKFNMF